MKVIVKGEAKAVDKYNNDILGENLRALDGIDCQSNFTDYIGKGDLNDALSHGYLRFEFEDGKLWSITEYESNRLLTPDELYELGEYTQGQWSDGIGEGFEQFECNGDGDFISPWFGNQKLQCFNVGGEDEETTTQEAWDIQLRLLAVGDEVYYARKRNYTANGELVRKTITAIKENGDVRMGIFTSTSPESQLIKIFKINK